LPNQALPTSGEVSSTPGQNAGADDDQSKTQLQETIFRYEQMR